ADSGLSRVLRIDPNGILTIVAGGGSSGLGDGGPAIQAQILPISVAVGPDGSLYLSDQANLRIRRARTSGTITTVAGSGQQCPDETQPCGNGGAATQAHLSFPQGIAVGPDGSIYFAELLRVRRVGPDGIITTVAGTGASLCGVPPCGDG